MRRAVIFCAVLTLSSMFFTLSSVKAQDNTVSLDDVVMLVQSDISTPTILTFLKYRSLDFELDAEALQQLRAAGVSEEIIRSMRAQEASSVEVAPAPAYVVATGYNTAYPSYYYGARLVGATTFPLSWYSHHYYHHGYTSIYRPNTHYAAFSDGLSHAVGGSLGHNRQPAHLPGTYGGDHQVGHSSAVVGHSGRGGRSVGHGARHNISH